MNTSNQPSNELKVGSNIMQKRKMSRRGALIATGLTVFATPAFASLIVQNYMEADFNVADACFVKIAGRDTLTYLGTDLNDPLATFDGVTNTIQVDGANLIEEKLRIRGMKGDRVTYTDVVRYQNNCDIPLQVSLIASSATATGDWADRSARIYISDQASPVGAAIPTKPSGAPGAPASGWNGTPIVVEVGGAIPASNAQTGTVVVAPGQEIFGALTLAAGTAATTTGVGTVNWVAQALNAN